MDKEIKSFHTLATKVLDAEQGIVEHYVAVMGNIDLTGDVIHPGAFSKSIMERGLKIKVLDQHNTQSVRNIVGKPLALREVGRLELPDELLKEYPDATGGLLAKTQFLLDTPEGRGVFDRIKSGAVDQYSIGYDPIITDYMTLDTAEGKQTVRNLREVRLWEYSPVVFAANPATSTLSAKDAAPAEGKPEPGEAESEDEFMGRCVPMVLDEGTAESQDQAVAICMSKWREKAGEPGDDEDDGKRRRRRRMPAAGTGNSPNGQSPFVPLGDAAAGDDPDEAKAGRRVRREQIEKARAAHAALGDFIKWADYDDEVADEAAKAIDRAAEKAAGPEHVVPPPTAQWHAQVAMLELEIEQLEVLR